MTIKLGGSYQDRITGFTGVATGFVQYITGCNQALLAPRVSDNGSLVQSEWFDEQRLVPFNNTVITLDNGSTPGYDRSAPRR